MADNINQELKSRAEKVHKNTNNVLERLNQLEKRNVNLPVRDKDEIWKFKMQIETADHRLETVERAYQAGRNRSVDLRYEYERALKELSTLWHAASVFLSRTESLADSSNPRPSFHTGNPPPLDILGLSSLGSSSTPAWVFATTFQRFVELFAKEPNLRLVVCYSGGKPPYSNPHPDSKPVVYGGEG